MRHLVLVAALAIVAAVPASAQVDPARAFPLAVGNAWEFDGGALRWDVVGEQTVGGVRIALLRFDGGPTCGVRTSADPLGRSVSYRVVDVADPGAVCPFTTEAVRYPWFNESQDGRYGAFGVSGTPRTAQVTIGDTTLVERLWGSIVLGGIGVRQVDVHDVLDGIGVVRFDRWWTYGGGTQISYVFTYELTYARINGVEYGRRAVAGEAGPTSAAARLTVRPNPARGRAELAVSLPESGPVRVAVLDALGRRVAVLLDGEHAAGERSVPVDTSRWPAGVYVVRAEAGGRVSTARLVVAR